ncbi:hypothetical protein Dimus_029974, partial [Dionaea muscipula]
SDRSFSSLANLGIGAVSLGSFPGVPSNLFAYPYQVQIHRLLSLGAGQNHLRITIHSSPDPTGSSPLAGAVSSRSDRDFDDCLLRVLGADCPRDFSRSISHIGMNTYRQGQEDG